MRAGEVVDGQHPVAPLPEMVSPSLRADDVDRGPGVGRVQLQLEPLSKTVPLLAKTMLYVVALEEAFTWAMACCRLEPVPGSSWRVLEGCSR